MKPPVLDPSERPATLGRRTPRSGRPAPGAGAKPGASGRGRLGARLAAWLFRAPAGPDAAPPPADPPAPVDARELSSWAPFSPRF